MAIDSGDFIRELDGISPDIERMVSEHLVEYDGDLLLHLLVADVGRVVESAYRSDDEALLRGCLDVMDRGLREGDDAVQNAVAVSFVEHMIVDLPRRAINSWPSALRAEAERMIAWRPADDGLP